MRIIIADGGSCTVFGYSSGLSDIDLLQMPYCIETLLHLSLIRASMPQTPEFPELLILDGSYHLVVTLTLTELPPPDGFLIQTWVNMKPSLLALNIAYRQLVKVGIEVVDVTQRTVCVCCVITRHYKPPVMLRAVIRTVDCNQIHDVCMKCSLGAAELVYEPIPLIVPLVLKCGPSRLERRNCSAC